MNSTPIILAFNQDFTLPALTTIYSLIQHCSDLRRIEFFIFYDALNPYVMHLIEKFIHSCGPLVTFIKCSTAFEGYNIPTHDPRHPKEVFFPLLIPKYFASYDQALFLDSDLFIRDDILTMIDAMPNDKKIGAVKDTYHSHLHTSHIWGFEDYTRNTLQIRHYENYFNSGVVLFNTKNITTEEAKHCIELIKNQWQSHDESILNYLFQDSLHLFPSKWNVNIEYMHLPPEEFRQSFQSDLIEGRQNAAICHFAGPSKPWQQQPEYRRLTYYPEYESTWHALQKRLAPLAAEILCGSLWDSVPPK